MTDLRVALNEVVAPSHRPQRPVRVTPLMHQALPLLRQALIRTAEAGGTMTYQQASEASGGAYPARGMGKMLDVLGEDCRRRDEPSLAALVVTKGAGEVGEAYVGDAPTQRRDCWSWWSAGDIPPSTQNRDTEV